MVATTTATIAMTATVTTNRVYLIAGVSGSGKSWVCDKLSSLVHVYSVDRDGYITPTKTLSLYEITTNISSTIAKLKEKGLDVIPIFVTGDFLTVKSQILSRGGKITPSLYSRWKRINSLAARYGSFSGSSSEVYEHLRSLLKHRDVPHIIYRVTSPSGKVYIGKTSQTLEKRRYDHEFYARKNGSTPFARSILKYGDQLRWETVETIVGLEEANRAESRWIASYQSCNPEKGYNLTIGGDGGARNAETESKRIDAIRRALSRPESRSKLSSSTSNLWKRNRSSMSSAIRDARSTEESRLKTKKQMDKQKTDPAWLSKISAASRESKAKPEVKAKLSTSGKKAREREFEVIKDGVVVGRYLNQADAAKDLGVMACSISRCLGGYLKQTKGYQFRYLEELE